MRSTFPRTAGVAALVGGLILPALHAAHAAPANGAPTRVWAGEWFAVDGKAFAGAVTRGKQLTADMRRKGQLQHRAIDLAPLHAAVAAVEAARWRCD